MTVASTPAVYMTLVSTPAVCTTHSCVYLCRCFRLHHSQLHNTSVHITPGSRRLSTALWASRRLCLQYSVYTAPGSTMSVYTAAGFTDACVYVCLQRCQAVSVGLKVCGPRCTRSLLDVQSYVLGRWRCKESKQAWHHWQKVLQRDREREKQSRRDRPIQELSVFAREVIKKK